MLLATFVKIYIGPIALVVGLVGYALYHTYNPMIVHALSMLPH